ncbi:hypothetical protein BDW22DRAFT_1484660 [Trametopsis cervina]|nr:hypothetical protein BDW22DRAFT_1484660 [Trametopsis cervina]
MNKTDAGKVWNVVNVEERINDIPRSSEGLAQTRTNNTTALLTSGQYAKDLLLQQSPSALLQLDNGMISHATLYNLANGLGALAMLTVVAYHFVAVNARSLSGESGKKQ